MRTSDDNATPNTIFVLYSLDGHVQGGNTIIDISLRKSSQAEFLESVVGIRNQFPKENISKVRVRPKRQGRNRDPIPIGVKTEEHMRLQYSMRTKEYSPVDDYFAETRYITLYMD